MMSRPIVLTPGDPQGVGPEVAIKALRRYRFRKVVLCGDPEVIEAEAARQGVRVARIHDLEDEPRDALPLLLPAINGEPVEVSAIRRAVTEIRAGRASALVTGPIHKGRLMARGFPHAGHTEFLGELCQVRRPVMAFVGGTLRVALVTVHKPLRGVAEALTADLIAHTVRTAHDALRNQLRVESPRLLVCGVNPHAGDDGALGHEEIDLIGPVLRALRDEGIRADGPVSAENAFKRAARGGADMVIAMYHDQGLAPLKLADVISGQPSVNWTLGLPLIRTSVDHGTADDIVGKGIADEGSMIAALRWAATLADRA